MFGRTIQMWNPWQSTDAFAPGTPWLLRCFDQIRLVPVSHAELAEARACFPHGRYQVRIEPATFSLRDYTSMLLRGAAGIAGFKRTQQAAFEAERRRWAEQGLDAPIDEAVTGQADQVHSAADALPPGCVAVVASAPGACGKWR